MHANIFAIWGEKYKSANITSRITYFSLSVNIITMFEFIQLFRMAVAAARHWQNGDISRGALVATPRNAIANRWGNCISCWRLEGKRRRSVGIFMTIQSAQQLPIKIFPQKTTAYIKTRKHTHIHTHRHSYGHKEGGTDGHTAQSQWPGEQKKRRKKGFCVRLINCFAHVFRAKCLPERINPTKERHTA